MPTKQSQTKDSGKISKKEEKAKKLQSALRKNLMRRKTKS